MLQQLVPHLDWYGYCRHLSLERETHKQNMGFVYYLQAEWFQFDQINGINWQVTVCTLKEF